MKREDLKALGLADDVIDQVMGLHGKTVEKHKTDLASLTTERDALKTQLGEAGKQIEGFKSLDIEGVKRQADEWKQKAEQAAKDAENQVKALRFDVALKDALKSHKVKDPADVIPHLKRDALTFGDDGQIIGLKEQIEPLKTAKNYLFESDEKQPEFVKSGNPPDQPVTAFMQAFEKGLGLQKQGN